MEILYLDGNVLLKNVTNFNLSDIFECGQCFRFNRLTDGSYLGTAFGKTIRLSQNNNTIILHNTSIEDYDKIWHNYFDLDRNYNEIKATLTQDNDTVMLDASTYGDGIRILNQELWETIISFIISASNNIPRIKKIIELLCENFGEPHSYDGHIHYSFPSPKAIASLTEDELSVIRAGFRTKYILSCAKSVASGQLELDRLYNLPTKEAKEMLMTINGIGNKVSDCILLFSLGRFDSFPVDVWIKRIVEYCYFDSKEQSIKTISQFAEQKFGNLGGIAQQYLFYYARSLRIGT